MPQGSAKAVLAATVVSRDHRDRVLFIASTDLDPIVVWSASTHTLRRAGWKGTPLSVRHRRADSQRHGSADEPSRRGQMSYDRDGLGGRIPLFTESRHVTIRGGGGGDVPPPQAANWRFQLEIGT